MKALTAFADWLNRNPWLNVVFLLLAIFSIVVSIALYFRSRKEKRPCFYSRTYRLIEDRVNTIDAVEILYRGHKVENLTLTKIAFWNRGRETVNKDDVAPIDPIRLVLNQGCELLAAEIVYSHNPANNFRVAPDLTSGEVGIAFDYFHTHEGIVIQVYYTGKRKDDVALRGTIKGVASIPRIAPDAEPLTDWFVGMFNRIINRINPVLLRGLVMISVIVVTIAPVFALLLIDKVTSPMRRLPRQYALD